jgi:hypothetical protein
MEGHAAGNIQHVTSNLQDYLLFRVCYHKISKKIIQNSGFFFFAYFYESRKNKTKTNFRKFLTFKKKNFKNFEMFFFRYFYVIRKNKQKWVTQAKATNGLLKVIPVD